MRCWFPDKDGCQTINVPKLEMPTRGAGNTIRHYRLTGSSCVSNSATNPMAGNVLKTLKPINPNPDCVGYKGSIQSFSGTATIRPATTNIAKNYYSNRSAYLKKRQNYETSASFHTSNGVTVSNYTGCKVAYNPNNATFATQGAVESRDRIQRLQYNTITANNYSFYKQYQLRFPYTTNPIWFVKLEYETCRKC